MVSVCFYFQVHQPWRLRKYSVFDIGNNHEYFHKKKNEEIIKKVAQKAYRPTNRLIHELIRKTDGKFRVSYSVTGVTLEQFETHTPDLIESFKQLADTGAVEFLSETYHHTLAFLYSKREFKEQVMLHKKKMKELFGQTPKIFRNTELVYNNELASYVEKMGFKGILAEGADHILGWRSPNFVYKPINTEKIKLLLKNYKLSDDIAFRFSNHDWKEWPLTVDKFVHWLNQVNGNGNCVNLFMDYETFGEHQWATTGIFRFLKALPEEIMKHPDNNFMTPSEVIEAYEPVSELDIHHVVSWADVERDLSAWMGNKMQQNALNEIYLIENAVRKSGDKKLMAEWRKLQTSDHFYYMCTKWFNDGDVHKYFNPYDNPYDGFIAYMNVLNDFIGRLKLKNKNIYKLAGIPNILKEKEATLNISETPSQVFKS